MSPILVRPVREQLEHDRVIRLLQTKFRRRFDAAINPGAEQNAPVGPGKLYPDVVLSQGRGRQPLVVIEVETGESVNHLEALAEWAHFARLRPAFHLYVPSTMVDVARRLCTDNAIQTNEIWSYHGLGDEIRFTLVHKTRDAGPKVRASARGGASRGAAPVKKKAASRSHSAARTPRKASRGTKRR